MEVQYKIGRLLRMEEYLNRLKVEKDSYVYMHEAMNTHLDEWDEIIDELYERYPNLEKYEVDINELVGVITSLTPRIEIKEGREKDFIQDYAWEISEIIVDWCQNINKLLEDYAAVKQ